MNDNRLHVISLEKKNHMKEYMYKDVSNMHKIMQYYDHKQQDVVFISQNVSVFIQMNISPQMPLFEPVLSHRDLLQVMMRAQDWLFLSLV